MTLEELELTLPSGLHDAILLRLAIDYGKRQMSLDLDVDVGDPDAAHETAREARRRACVTLSGLVFCVIDPPDPRYSFDTAGPLTIDSGTGEPDGAPGIHQPVPQDAHLAWIFVSRWNAFIRFAAENATLDWLE